MSKTIEEAVKDGDLITLKKAREMLNYSEEEKKRIREGADRIILDMRLRQMRKEMGLTQEELAHKARIPRTTVTKIESGRHNVTIATLQKIASAVGKEFVYDFIEKESISKKG